MSSKHNLGFTLIELLIVIAILGIGYLWVSSELKNYAQRSHLTELQSGSINVCEWTESDLATLAGGAAIGTAITANAAGSSLILIMTQSGIAAVVAPAVAPVVTIGATGVAASYATIRSYCAASKELPMMYQFAVDQMSQTFEILSDSEQIFGLVPHNSEK